MTDIHIPVTLPSRFHPAYRALMGLARYPRYLGAFIFGSVAMGDATGESDLDAIVVTAERRTCENINHPVINGVKMDITFPSLAEIKRKTCQQIEKHERPPWIANALIVFDKTGELGRLQAEVEQIRPKLCTPDAHQYIQFMIWNADSKVARHLKRDPSAALLVMHSSLLDLIHFHYRIHERWIISDKRILTDLRIWDTHLAAIVEQFVALSDARAKYRVWSAMIDHILAPLGGRLPITGNNCGCDACGEDIAALVAPVLR